MHGPTGGPAAAPAAPGAAAAAQDCVRPLCRRAWTNLRLPHRRWRDTQSLLQGWPAGKTTAPARKLKTGKALWFSATTCVCECADEALRRGAGDGSGEGQPHLPGPSPVPLPQNPLRRCHGRPPRRVRTAAAALRAVTCRGAASAGDPSTRPGCVSAAAAAAAAAAAPAAAAARAAVAAGTARGAAAAAAAAAAAGAAAAAAVPGPTRWVEIINVKRRTSDAHEAGRQRVERAARVTPLTCCDSDVRRPKTHRQLVQGGGPPSAGVHRALPVQEAN